MTTRLMFALTTFCLLNSLATSTVNAQPQEATPSGDQAILKRFVDEMVVIDPRRQSWSQPTAYGQLGSKPGTPQALAMGLQISRYEVTQELWQTVTGENPSRWKGPRNSVEMLSLTEAIEFCDALTAKLRSAGLLDKDHWVRLPTEFEWEFAIRAGTTTDYSFGNDATQLGDYAWSTENAAGNDPPVGAKRPNAWGLYDGHGYLWEWCLSLQSPDDSLKLTPENWTEQGETAEAVLRGGSWKDPAAQLRTGVRRIAAAELQDDAVGLRCVIVGPLPRQPLPGFQPPTKSQLLTDSSRMEWLWNEGEFTEGPAAAPDGSIYFSDIGNRILRWDSTSKSVAVVQDPSGRSNGMMFTPSGKLVVCEGANTGGGRRISIGTPAGPRQTLSDSYQGGRFNSPNDLVVDRSGRVYFTDPRYVGDEPRELDFEAVFVIDPDSTTRIATREVAKPNGIVLSPDGSTAYVADHAPNGPRTLLSFSVASDGTFQDKQVLFDFGKERGIDGMTIDRQGRVYATAGSGNVSGIYVFAPDGTPLDFIPTPGSPTNCVFGIGDEADWLYVTAAGPADWGTAPAYGLGRIQLKTTGFHVVKPN